MVTIDGWTPLQMQRRELQRLGGMALWQCLKPCLACLSALPRTRGRSCMASLKAQRERRARLAGAPAPGPTVHSSAAHPAAAPAAEAAHAAAQTHAHGLVTQDSTRVIQRVRAIGSAAASRSSSPVAADDTSGSSSGSSYAPSTADGAPEAGGAPDNGPHAGGASHLAAVWFDRPSGHGCCKVES